MKAKEFFKSTSFRCIAVLLGIVLVCGIFLTLCNALFAVSDQERFDRALEKIYGGPVETEAMTFTEEQADVGNAVVVSAYKVKTDGNYLLQVQGKNGYMGGTVTCWVVVKMGINEITGIGNVTIAQADSSQSWVNNNTSYLGTFSENFKADTDFEVIKTGATGSFTAITNAVNGAVAFVKSVVLGEEIVTKTTPYDDYAYTAYIDKEKTTHSFEGGAITYHIVTAKNDLVPDPYTITVKVNAVSGAIDEYTIVSSGAIDYEGHEYSDLEYGNKFSSFLAGKTAEDIKAVIGDADDLKFGNSTIHEYEDGAISSGATMSNFANLYAALFATANVQRAVASAFAYTSYIDADKTTYSYDAESGLVTYHIVTAKNDLVPDPYTVTVKVNAVSGAIAEYTIVSSGAIDYEGHEYSDLEYGNKFSSFLAGKTAEDIKAVIGDADDLKYGNSTIHEYEDGAISSGATMSNFANLYAALYATSNYEIVMILGGAN